MSRGPLSRETDDWESPSRWNSPLAQGTRDEHLARHRPSFPRMITATWALSECFHHCLRFDCLAQVEDSERSEKQKHCPVEPDLRGQLFERWTRLPSLLLARYSALLLHSPLMRYLLYAALAVVLLLALSASSFFPHILPF